MIEVRGRVEQVESHSVDGRERWVYCCLVCGFYSRKFQARDAASAAGLDHEERGRCVNYRAERLPF